MAFKAKRKFKRAEMIDGVNLHTGAGLEFSTIDNKAIVFFEQSKHMARSASRKERLYEPGNERQLLTCLRERGKKETGRT